MSAHLVFDISTWDGSLATLPPLDELNVHPETLAVAEAIVSSFDGPTIETHILEWLIAAIVLLERDRRSTSPETNIV